MPSSPAARTARLSASTPCRCPSRRGRPRAAARRPLPSIMMATCSGASSEAASKRGAGSGKDIRFPLHRHDFFFFAGQNLVHIGNGLIGRLLHLALVALDVILAHVPVSLELLQMVEPVATYVPDGDTRGFSVFMRDLDEFLPPLLVELGDADAHHLPFG